MAAFDIPLSTFMQSNSTDNSHGFSARDSLEPGPSSRDPNPPTLAPFAPPSFSASRSGYQVAQKSPLLIATPPQITRALSQSHPYVRAGNKFLGLLTWTSGDPWESFLLVAVFWAVVLYGEVVLKYVGPVVVALGLAVVVFLWRFQNGDIHPSLDEILETLQTFTARLNIFFDPFFTLVQYFSVERTATTISPLAIRMLVVTPIWLLLAVWPFQIVTGRRIIITSGTLILSWHSRPAKVTRTILWRSLTIRRICERLSGLSFISAPRVAPPIPPRKQGGAPLITPNAPTTSLSTVANSVPLVAAKVAPGSTPLQPGPVSSPGVKFTFVIYENQRRWLGIGWNTSLFAYERAPWTDESLEPCPPPVEFQLPETPSGSGVRWRWVPREDWRVDGQDTEGKKHGKKQVVKDKLGGSGVVGEGWIYYDNKWNHGTREGADSWGKYTRRRKWIRNAELVENHQHIGGSYGGNSRSTGSNGNGVAEAGTGVPVAQPPAYTETPDALELEESTVPSARVTTAGRVATMQKKKSREVLEEDERWHD